MVEAVASCLSAPGFILSTRWMVSSMSLSSSFSPKMDAVRIDIPPNDELSSSSSSSSSSLLSSDEDDVFPPARATEVDIIFVLSIVAAGLESGHGSSRSGGSSMVRNPNCSLRFVFVCSSINFFASTNAVSHKFSSGSHELSY